MNSKVKIFSGFLTIIVALGLIAFLPLTAYAKGKPSEDWGTKQFCSTLGGKEKHFHLDIDAYTFEGKKGEKVSITLSPDLSGSHRGEQATLILTSRFKPFFKIDRGSLPNKVSTVLPAQGEYFVYVIEQHRTKQNKSFHGSYCLTLESSNVAWRSFKPAQPPSGSKHTITWIPERVEETLSKGTTKELKIAFISRIDLKKANLWVTPELRPFISLTPNVFDKVEANTPYEVSLRLTIPTDVSTGLYDGTIHLRVGSRTYPETLKVKLNVVQVVNQPPIANAGADQVIALPEGQITVDVQLDGSGSHDPDGTIASYTWTGTPDPEDVISPRVTLKQGIHEFTLQVTDNKGATSSDKVKISVLGPPFLVPLPEVTGEQIITIKGISIPGATINVVNKNTGETKEIINDKGLFEIPFNLTSGPNEFEAVAVFEGLQSATAKLKTTYTSTRTLILNSISPSSGQSGSIITLTGSGFTPDKDVMGVYFRGSEREQEGFVLEATETTLKVVIPFVFLATEEDVEVYAYDGTNMSNSLVFHIQPASDPTPNVRGNEVSNEFDLLILNVQRTFGKLEQLLKPYIPQEKWAQMEENFNRLNTFLLNVKNSLPSDYDPQMLSALDSIFGSDIFFLINQQLDQINEILSHSTTGEAICNVNEVLGILNDIISILRWVNRALIAAEVICAFVCQAALPVLEVAREIVETILEILVTVRDVLNLVPTQADARSWEIKVVGPYPGVDPRILFTYTTNTLGLYADFSNGGINRFVGRISMIGKFVLDLLGIDLGRITIRDVNVPSKAHSLNRNIVSNLTTVNDPNMGANVHTLEVLGLPDGLKRQSVRLDVQGTCGPYHYPDRLCRTIECLANPPNYTRYYDVTVIEAPIIENISWWKDYGWGVSGLGFSTMCGNVFKVFWNGQEISCNCISDLTHNSFLQTCYDEPGRFELMLVDPADPNNRDKWRRGPSTSVGLPPFYNLSIERIIPSSGFIGDIITVSGNYFSPYPEDLEIAFYADGNWVTSINPIEIITERGAGSRDVLKLRIPEELYRHAGKTLGVKFQLNADYAGGGGNIVYLPNAFNLRRLESAVWGDQDLIAFGEPNGYIRSALIDDITGDGINDLIVGVSQDQSGLGKYMGAVYIAFGPVSGTPMATGQQYIDLNINAADIRWDVVISGDYTACYAQNSNFCRRIGNSLAIGDINGDGIKDLVIGSTDLSDEGVHLLNPDDFQDTHLYVGSKGHIGGAAYVYYGRPREQWHRRYDTPYGEYDVRIRGDNIRELGYQVAVANLNGDNFGDIIISAPQQPFNPGQPDLDWSGRVYVIFGGNALPQNIEVSNIPTSINGAVILGESLWQRISTTEYKGDGLGQGIAVGDINGDGLDDLLIGAPRYYVMYFISGEGSIVRKGAVFLFYGRNNFGGDDGYLNATSYTGEQDVLILGPKISESPFDFNPGWEIGRVMLIKDLNNDGKGELILASPHEFLQYKYTVGPGYGIPQEIEIKEGHVGLVYILNGNSIPQSGVIKVNDLVEAKIYGSATISRFGASLATADVDSDGYKDLLVGAPGRIGGASGKIGEEDPGHVWGFYGSNNLPTGEFQLIDRSRKAWRAHERTYDFLNDFLIKGEQAHPNKRYGFGTFVTAGDLNPFVGDDVLIIDPLARAPEPSSPGTWRNYSGMLYIFYEGNQGLWPVTIYPESVTLNACDDQQIFRVSGGKSPYLFAWGTPNVPPQIELEYQYGDNTAMVRLKGCVPFNFNTLRLKVFDGDPTTYEDVVATINILHKPDIRVNPNRIEYIDVPLGNTASQAVIVKNDGTADLNISGITIGGISPQHFRQSHNCPATLNPGAFCTVTVTFTPPNTYQAWWATLSINSDDPDEPVVNVTLSGYGIPPALSLSPQVLDMGETTTSNILYITNNFTTCVTPLNWEIAGGLPSWLFVSDRSGTITVCGGTSAIIVQVNRSRLPVGMYSHNISITSNSGSGSVEVRMSVPTFISVTPSTLDFAEARKRLPLTIRNTSYSSTALTWNISSALPPWLTASQTSGVIPAGGSTTVYLFANRTGLYLDRAYSDTISITSNGGNLTIPVSLFNPMPLATFAKYYGGDGGEYFSKIRQTSDGGFIAVGLTNSFGAGNEDAWVVKLDSSGYVEWERTYGGRDAERAYDVRETSDGQYLVVGGTYSFTTNNYGLWILKLDAYGDIQWQKEYGGDVDDNWGSWGKEFSIQLTQDGGYIVAGNTDIIQGGGRDLQVWVLRLDSSGNIQWQKTYGDNRKDYANSIQVTADGGYIVVGSREYYKTGQTLDLDMWVLKLDANGTVLWEKSYGGDYWDIAYSVQQTADNGYIMTGYSSFGSALVLKLDSFGNIEWQKTYGGWDGYGHSIKQTQDGGYILAGSFYRSDRGDDIWVVKLDSSGNIEWQRAYGGDFVDVAYHIEQTSEGDYIVAGYTNSFRRTPYGRNFDTFVLKIDSIGNIGATCGIMDLTSVTPENTSIVPVDTFASVSDSSTIPLDTNATVTDSLAVTETLCYETIPEAGQRHLIDIDVVPMSYDFGDVRVRNTVSQIFTVKNAGYMPLTISDISLSGSFDYAGEHNCPRVLDIARRCEITISFTPSVVGEQQAYLWIESNDPDEGLIQIPITGTGVQEECTPEICPGGETPPPGAIPFGGGKE